MASEVHPTLSFIVKSFFTNVVLIGTVNADQVDFVNERRFCKSNNCTVQRKESEKEFSFQYSRVMNVQ